jgi:hypothetical protein
MDFGGIGCEGVEWIEPCQTSPVVGFDIGNIEPSTFHFQRRACLTKFKRKLICNYALLKVTFCLHL